MPLPQRFLTDIYMVLFYKPWTTKKIVLCCFCIPLLIILSGIFFINIWTLEIWPWYPSVERWCEREKVPDYMLNPDSNDNEITIVTMFLDLGVFKKGDKMLAYHSPYKYRCWMRVFGHLGNPVLALMENEEDIEYFRNIRSCLPSSLTKIVKVKREDLSSFRQRSKINQIYSQPSYPKHYPNTVNPDYACAMNAKYDALEMACQMNYFKTPYVAWLDIGLFRNLDGTNPGFFKLAVPSSFNADNVAMSEAWPQFPYLLVKDIMLDKHVWVSGSMILATKEVMMNFTHRYKDAVVELLNKGLSNSDQEVIHSMYTHKMKKPNQVKIQSFHCKQGQFGLWGPDARYFCLGYMCKSVWRERL